MKTKWLDARIKRYEDWDKHNVIKPNEKLELIELIEIKKQLLLHNVSNCSGGIPYDSLSDSFKKSIDSIEDNLNR